MKKICIVLIILIIPLKAKADISWMKGISDCESFSSALDAYLERVDLSKYSMFPFWQKEELAIALREACTGSFSKCDLDACKKWGSLTTFSAPNDTESHSSLAWLNRFLTCEQLMEQIKSRYSNLGEKELADKSMQKEFKLVLSAACSDRFAHCSFSSCEQFSQGQAGKEQLTNLNGKPKVKNQAENFQALKDSIIKIAIEKENKEGLVWKKFSNPTEVEIISKRKEEARNRKEYQSSSSLSSNNRNYNSFSSASSQYAQPKKRNYSNSSSSGLKKGILPF